MKNFKMQLVSDAIMSGKDFLKSHARFEVYGRDAHAPNFLNQRNPTHGSTRLIYISEIQGVLAMGGITQWIPSTRHKWTHSALTPARQAGTRFTYPGGMEGW